MARDEKGLTIVEALITGIISAIVLGAAFTFVTFSGRGTDQINALQVLQQESSMISELFFRAVRNGSQVVEINSGNEIKADSVAITDVNHIRIKGAQDVDFRINNNMVEIDDNGDGNFRIVSTRLCTAESPNSLFNVMPYSRGAQIQISLQHSINDIPYTYTTTLGGVRCQNGK